MAAANGNEQVSTSYLLRFRKLIQDEVSLKENVRNCRQPLSLDGFRSILWARWIGILPELKDDSCSEWLAEATKLRSRYDILKERHCNDKREDPSLNPAVNNPLSQDTESPWNKYFEDCGLRKDIERDVDRMSCEDHSILKERGVRSMMLKILFIYGKEQPKLSYRQGMHELLLTLLAVKSDDIKMCQDIIQEQLNSSMLAVVKDLLNPDFLEHDIFALFEAVMAHMWDWYFVGSPSPMLRAKINGGAIINSSGKAEGQAQRPFERDKEAATFLEEYATMSNSARRLQNIWVNILKVHDVDLFNHLEGNGILPSTFGIKWTKLLFSRQVADYIPLWDAIIVSKFSLVDYIVASMILAVKTILMRGDSNVCNSILVSKYPSNVNSRYLILKALHLFNSKKYPAPNGSPFPLSSVEYCAELTGSWEKLDAEETSGIVIARRVHHASNRDSSDSWKSMSQVQDCLRDVKDAMAKSRCNHKTVIEAVNRLQVAVNNLESNLSPRNSMVSSRRASVAFDATNLS